MNDLKKSVIRIDEGMSIKGGLKSVPSTPRPVTAPQAMAKKGSSAAAPKK